MRACLFALYIGVWRCLSWYGGDLGFAASPVSGRLIIPLIPAYVAIGVGSDDSGTKAIMRVRGLGFVK